MAEDGLWVTSATYFRDEVLWQAATDIVSAFFARIAQPYDEVSVRSEPLYMGVTLVVRHRLDPDC